MCIRDRLNLVSLAGVYSPKQKIEDSKVPVTLGRLLEKDKTIRRIVLHLDNDIAGRKATKALQTILSDKYEVCLLYTSQRTERKVQTFS